MAKTITINAPAKLNLALSVGPPVGGAAGEAGGGGGMHPICSWMVTVDLHDELTLTRLDQGSLSRYAILWHKDAKRRSEINWSITKDLAVRAHLAMEKHIGQSLPVQMKLEKRIPVGGGLGGGSSDAAAMLRAVNQLFDLGVADEDLGRIGAELGSDVPFLVRGGSAVVEGLGERIMPVTSLVEINAVLAFPDAACPTGRVYGLFDELSNSSAALRSDLVREMALSMARLSHDAPFNDLARAAIQAAPRLEQDMADLARLAERAVHISGSGSSLFVLCDDPAHADALAQSVERTLNLPAVAVRGVS